MKLILFSLIFALFGCSIGAKSLAPSFAPDKKSSGIFGVFIQRLGFSSGGVAQFIHLRDSVTKKTIAIQVKPTWTSKKENFFSAEIPPGDYEVFMYFFAEGGVHYRQYVIKAENSGELESMLSQYEGKFEEHTFPKYQLKIYPNEVVYVGTWDFSVNIPSFKLEAEKAFKMGKEEKQYYLVETSKHRLPN